LAALHAQVFSLATEPAQFHPPELDDDELLRRVRDARNGAKFAALWAGDTSAYRSPSEADLALCSLLAFWTSEPARIDNLFRQSSLMRPKWDEQHGDITYGERTIRRAIGSTRQRRIDAGSTMSSTGKSSESRATATSAGKASQATRIVNLALEEGVELFHDHDDNAYMDVPVGAFPQKC
jgi:primase-polymerase (primpol)-like protein